MPDSCKASRNDLTLRNGLPCNRPVLEKLEELFSFQFELNSLHYTFLVPFLLRRQESWCRVLLCAVVRVFFRFPFPVHSFSSRLSPCKLLEVLSQNCNLHRSAWNGHMASTCQRRHRWALKMDHLMLILFHSAYSVQAKTAKSVLSRLTKSINFSALISRWKMKKSLLST